MAQTPQDLYTLQTQLDHITHDRSKWIEALQSKEKLWEQTLREIEQFKGALGYIDIQQKRLADEIASLSQPTK